MFSITNKTVKMVDVTGIITLATQHHLNAQTTITSQNVKLQVVTGITIVATQLFRAVIGRTQQIARHTAVTGIMDHVIQRPNQYHLSL